MKKPQKKSKTSISKPAIKPSPAAKRHGLGKGLGSLLGAVPVKPTPAPTTSTPGNAVVQINPATIERCPWQPRQTFDEVELNELAESIRIQGVIQPLLCRRVGAKVELIAGERRLRAALQVGLHTIPVLFLDIEDRDAAAYAIIENIQRKDLNAIEEAEGYRMLAEQFQLTQEAVATRIGKPRATIANAVRLLDLPDEAKQLVADGRLSTGQAKLLLSLDDAEEQVAMARRCVLENLTVRTLEAILEKRKNGVNTAPVAAPKPDMPPSYTQSLSDRLHRHFGTAVRLTPSVTYANGRHGKGCLEIDFYNNEDLTRILSLLQISVD